MAAPVGLTNQEPTTKTNYVPRDWDKLFFIYFILWSRLFPPWASLTGRWNVKNYARVVGKGGKFWGRLGTRAGWFCKNFAAGKFLCRLLKTVKKPFGISWLLDMRYLSGSAAPSRNTRCEIGCFRRAVLRPAIQGQYTYIKGCAKPHTIFVLLLGKKKFWNLSRFGEKSACTGALAADRKLPRFWSNKTMVYKI